MDMTVKVCSLLEEHPQVSDTQLIGSRARGDAHDFSDWHFAVTTDDVDRCFSTRRATFTGV